MKFFFIIPWAVRWWRLGVGLPCEGVGGSCDGGGVSSYGNAIDDVTMSMRKYTCGRTAAAAATLSVRTGGAVAEEPLIRCCVSSSKTPFTRVGPRAAHTNRSDPSPPPQPPPTPPGDFLLFFFPLVCGRTHKHTHKHTFA